MSVTAPNPAQQAAAPQRVVIPFVQAAHEHTEIVATFVHRDFSTAVTYGPYDVPAYGYLRSLLIDVQTTTAGTGGTTSADFPFNIFSSIQFMDVNGAPIVGPIDGYALMLANVVAGVQYQPDPARVQGYNAVGTTPAFALRIPLEITSHDCLGVLANQDSAAAYKVTLTTNTRSVIWSGGAPTTDPAITVKIWAECYTVPNQQDMLGNMQEQAPPSLGTAQYISYNTQPVLAGQNTIQVKRVGNLIESLILIWRNSAGNRDDTVAFQPFTLRWDGRDFWQAVDLRYLRQIGSERLNGTTVPSGTAILPFNTTTLSRMGNGPLRNMWPTTQSSRVEVVGSAAAAGSLQIVTVDMSVAQVNPTGRYVLDSATGWHPNVVAGAQG